MFVKSTVTESLSYKEIIWTEDLWILNWPIDSGTLALQSVSSAVVSDM